MSVKPFIFGGNTGHTYEDIKRLRAQADSMQPMKPISGGVAGYGQGLSAIGHAIAQRVMNNKADRLEAEGRQQFQTKFNKWAHMAANPATSPASQTAEGGQKPRTFYFDPSVLEMAASPHATPGQKLLMQLIAQKQIDSNDELKQMSIARQRLELEKMKNPERKILTGADGYQYYQDDGSRVLPNVKKPQPAKYQMLTTEQTQQLGLPEGAYQQGPQGRISQVGGGGVNVNLGGFNNAQAQAAGYADRMVQSENVLREIEQAGTSIKDKLANDAGIPHFVSDDYKRYEQAKRDFLNAKLRVESGAVISDQEIDNADKQYFPQWGDTPEVIAQKRRNREAAIFGTSRAAGQNYEQPQIRQPQQNDDGWVSVGGGVRIRRKQP